MRHRTAQRADWHIPIRPGTDGALALALMNVIISEGLTDEDYVANYTHGYDELVERVQQYTPEWASQETGIPAEDIRTLAREYATTDPSMIRIGVAVERHAGGGQTVRSIACLPALVGAWRHVGGGLLQLPLWAHPVNWPAFMLPELRTPGTRVVNQFLLGQALTGELRLDPPITALVVYNSNPMVVCPEQDKLRRGLERDDLFTVVSDHFLTDTARYADIVLPATTALEQHDIMFSWGHFYVTLNTPAVEPEGEAVSNTELFRRLSKAMGFKDKVLFRSDEELLASLLRLVGSGDAGNYSGVPARDRLGAAQPAIERRVRTARRGQLPHTVGQDRVPVRGARGAGQLRGQPVPAALRRPPTGRHRSIRCRTTSRPAKPARSTRSTCCPPSRTPTSTPAPVTNRCRSACRASRP